MKKFTSTCLFLLCLLAMPLQATAAEPLFQLQARTATDRLMVNWPRVGTARLAQAIDETREILAEQQQAAAQAIGNYRDSSNNYLLAAVMPGGLIYLAYQKNQLKLSEQALQLVTAEISELADDRLQLGLPVLQVAEATPR